MPEAESTNDGVIESFNPSTGTVEQSVVEAPAPAAPASSEPAQNPANQEARKPTPVDGGGNPERQPLPGSGKHWTARKIDELTRQREEIKRENDRLLAIVERSVGSRTAQEPPQKPPQAPVVSPEYANHPGLDPNDPEPSRDQFDDYDKYQRAIMRWETRMEVRGREAVQHQHAEQQRAVQETMQETAQIAGHFRNSAMAWAEEHPDYDDAVETLSHIRAEEHPAMTRAIFTSSNPAQVLHALSLVPHVADAITKMKPADQIKAVAHIEARLANAGASVSNAPPPMKPVGTTTATSRQAYRDDFTPEQHQAWKKANGIS